MASRAALSRQVVTIVTMAQAYPGAPAGRGSTAPVFKPCLRCVLLLRCYGFRLALSQP